MPVLQLVDQAIAHTPVWVWGLLAFVTLMCSALLSSLFVGRALRVLRSAARSNTLALA